MKTLASFLVSLFPLSLLAHDFWIFRTGEELRLYGGHNFPQPEVVPGKNISAKAFVYANGALKEIFLQREEKFLFSKGIKDDGLFAFSLQRAGRHVYCGFYIPSGIQAEKSVIIAEEIVKEVCGFSLSISLGPYPFKKENEETIRFSNEIYEPFSFYSEKGEKKNLFPSKSGKILFKVQESGHYLLVSQVEGVPVSFLVEVSE